MEADTRFVFVGFGDDQAPLPASQGLLATDRRMRDKRMKVGQLSSPSSIHLSSIRLSSIRPPGIRPSSNRLFNPRQNPSDPADGLCYLSIP